MNTIIYKLVQGDVNVYDESGSIVTLDVEVVLKIGLINGVNLMGDVKSYCGGGYELIGTTDHTGDKANYPISIYLEVDQSKWLSLEHLNYTYVTDPTEKIEIEARYKKIATRYNISGENYFINRVPYTMFSSEKGGSASTGECGFMWSNNGWGTSTIGRRTRICTMLRNYSTYVATGARTVDMSSTIEAIGYHYSGCMQIRMKV